MFDACCRLPKAFAKIHRNERGFTGLETATMAVAFITAAAILGYVIVNAAVFSANNVKDTIGAGYRRVMANMDISDSVIATSDNNRLSTIKITVTNANWDNPIDMTPCDGTANAKNKVLISLTTATDHLNNIKWSAAPIGYVKNPNLLEAGEQFEITVNLNDLGTGLSLSAPLKTNDNFSLRIKPAIGTSVTAQRTLPSTLEPVMDLN